MVAYGTQHGVAPLRGPKWDPLSNLNRMQGAKTFIGRRPQRKGAIHLLTDALCASGLACIWRAQQHLCHQDCSQVLLLERVTGALQVEFRCSYSCIQVVSSVGLAA